MGLINKEIEEIKACSKDYKSVEILETLVKAIQAIEDRIEALEKKVNDSK